MGSKLSAPGGIHPSVGINSLEPPHSFIFVSRPGAEDEEPSHSWTPVSRPGADDDKKIELLSLSWDQDYGCFAAGTTNGFRIYNCESCKETIRRDSRSDFVIVEMFHSNILALVGGGADPACPPNKLLIWDDENNRCIHQLDFKYKVQGVKIRQDRIAIVLEDKIYLYNFRDAQPLIQIKTFPNPRGLCCLSHHSNTYVLACPGLQRGQVRVNFGLKIEKLINAHDSQITCIELTLDGLLLATASTNGTVIRIFNTKDGTCIQEVRRGLEKAEIYSISFSPNVSWLAVSSDKGTLHVFSLRVAQDVSTEATNQGSRMVCARTSNSLDALISPDTEANTSSSLSFVKGVLPKYFISKRSFAQFHLPKVTRHIVAFGARNSVVIIGMDGSFCRCTFDPVNGGQMLQTDFVQFLTADGRGS